METAKQPKVLTASTLKGDKVTNAKGEDLGKVEEIMLDLERGQVAYVVLSFGRVNWIPNNKLFAVPWGSFSISFHDKLSNRLPASIETNGLMRRTLAG
jgi:sporulation protein YlmC with PRC-barrel domain